MRKLHLISSAATALAFTAFVGVSAAQQPQPNPQPNPAGDPQPAPQLRIDDKDKADHTLEGELVKVDTTAKLLTIETDSGKTEQVRYNDSTKITGAQSGIAGLADEDGTRVKVKFTGTGADRVASEIMVEKDKS